jgi:hypothetical protein
VVVCVSVALGTDGLPVAAQPAFSDISGSVASSQLSPGTASALGGVATQIVVAHNFMTGINTSGFATIARPSAADLSDAATTGNVLRGNGTSFVSAQLGASDLSNGVTGSGAVVLATSPTLTTPTIGVATATSIKQVSNAQFGLLDALGVNHFFISSASPYVNTFIQGNGSGNVFIGSAAKTSVADTTGNITMSGSTSGSTVIQASATASGTLTLPAATDTLVGKATTDTLTNKTIGSGGLAGLTLSKQIFTASGTFTIPTGVTSVKATVVGAGGAGGGTSGASGNNGEGGGSGGCAIKWLTGLTPGNTLTVTVGAGGTGVSNGTGNAGGTSSVSSGTQTISTITGGGGGGGSIGNVNDVRGTASGGDLNYKGGQSVGQYFPTTNLGGGGGSSIFGGAGLSGFLGVGNPADANSGSGGGGAGGGNAAAAAGGNGGSGIVIFEWMI